MTTTSGQTQQPSGGSTGGGPVGQGDYVVQAGDCMSSIAVAHGFFWQTLWDDPHNSELKSVRKNPNVLLPGDRVYIPEKRRKEVSGETDALHTFRRKGEPSRLRFQFLFRGEPRANEPYRVDIDGGETIEGQLDGEGRLDVGIPGSAKKARVIVGEGAEAEGYEFTLGGIDPVERVSGVQARLLNLGYACPQSGELDDATRGAIKAFQKDRGLEQTGETDDATRSALQDAHGS